MFNFTSGPLTAFYKDTIDGAMLLTLDNQTYKM